MNRIWIAAAATVVLLLAPQSTAWAQESPTQAWTADTSLDSWSTSVAHGPDGHPVVLGGICPSAGTDCELRLVKYNSTTGAVLWDVVVDDASPIAQDDPGGVSIGLDGNPVVVGTVCDDSTCRLQLAKFSGDTGATILSFSYGPSANLNFGADVSIGSDGNAVAVGSTCVSNTDCAMLVVRIDPVTGGQDWMQTFDAGAGLDQAFGVAVAENGDAIVTGDSCTPETDLCDFRTIRFAAADGAIVWNQIANSGTDNLSFGEFGYDVAIGSDGDPVISGVTCATTGSCNFRTIKRDGVTGSIIWNVLRASPNYDGGLGTDVAIGGDGNPIVAGQTCDPVSYGNCQPVVMKLDSATGNTLWELNSGSADSLALVAVTTQSDGNPIGTGWFTAPDGNTGIRTIKYLIQQPTPAGSAVSVLLNGGTSAPGGVSTTYNGVTTAGTTTLTAASTGPAPSEFRFAGPAPTYFDIQTSATLAASESIAVCVNYANLSFSAPEDQLRMYDLEGGVSWIDVTVSQSTITHVLCGEFPSLSLLAIGVPAP